VDIFVCGNFCVLTYQSICYVEIIALSNNQDFILYYTLYIENIFAFGYICSDLVKPELAQNSTVRNSPL